MSSHCIIRGVLTAALAVTRMVKLLCFSVVVITVNRWSVFQLNKANVYLLALAYNKMYQTKTVFFWAGGATQFLESFMRRFSVS